MRLEPYEGKHSRAVLRGVEGSDVLRLLNYASCHQIFRPELEGKPVIVLSNRDGNVVARSAEAKTLHVVK